MYASTRESIFITHKVCIAPEQGGPDHARISIDHRPLDAVDDDDVNGTFGVFELETELLLNGRVDVRRIGINRRWLGSGRRPTEWSAPAPWFERPFQVEVVHAGETGLVVDGTAGELRQELYDLGERLPGGVGDTGAYPHHAARHRRVEIERRRGRRSRRRTACAARTGGSVRR